MTGIISFGVFSATVLICICVWVGIASFRVWRKDRDRSQLIIAILSWIIAINLALNVIDFFTATW